jgi:hypothetical protein
MQIAAAAAIAAVLIAVVRSPPMGFELMTVRLWD